MSEQAFLDELKSYRIELWLDNDKLRLRAPEGAATPAILDKIKARKPEIIRYLEANTGNELSFPQKSMWTLHNLYPLSPAYNVACSIFIDAGIDERTLKLCLHKLLERHIMLRSVIKSTVEGPRFTTPLNFELDFHKHECAATASNNAERTDIQSLIRGLIDTPFNLDGGSVCRFHLINSTEENITYFVLVAHHIAVDFWSLEIILKELNILYRAAEAKDAAYLPEINKKYSDFVVEQQAYLDSEEAKKDWHYWSEKLAGDLPLLELSDRNLPQHKGHLTGSKLQRIWTKETFNRVVEIARKYNCSPFIFSLSAFFILIAKYSNKSDIVVGIPTSGRTNLDFEGLVGHFVNALPLREDIDQNIRFIDLLKKVSQQVIQSLEHQRYPFPLMVQHQQADRDASGNSPIFQCLFNWNQNRGDEALDKILSFGKLDFATSNGVIGASHELTVTVAEMDDGCHVVWNYANGYFSNEFVEHLANSFEVLLEQFIANPEIIIRDVVLYQQASIDIANESSAAACNVYQTFVQNLETHSDAIAIEDDNAAYTYQQLYERARQIAVTLSTKGIEAGDRVGIFLPMSCDAVAIMLACWQLGASYVPIDPALPEERVLFIYDDAKLALLFIHNDDLPVLSNSSRRMLLLSTIDNFNSTESLGAPASINVDSCSSELIAYVIYTSGSTGTPKGVEVSHRALSNLINWHLQTYQVKCNEIASQIAGFGFDAAVWELWPYLTVGACVKVVNESVRLDTNLLIQWLIDNKINYSFMPTPMAETVLIQNRCKDLTLKYLLTGGDKLTFNQAGELPFILVNHYGPTEFAVVATSHQLQTPESGGNSTYNGLPPIGTAIHNNNAYVIDQYGCPLPVGGIGELFLAGTSLAQGYLGRASLTAKQFLPNPFSSVPGERMYRTGDIVRKNLDGSLMFVSRADQQIKLRGYRIELGEIQNVLRRIDGVDNAVVRLHKDEMGNDLIAAYVIAQPGKQLLHIDITQQIAKVLPAYMIPTSINQIAELPLTVNGKIDYKALPAPEIIKGDATVDYVAPRTFTEELLADLWATQLNIDRVGINDDFFTLGGHSLMAMQLTARIQQVTGSDCSIGLLFENRTVEKLAAAMATNKSSDGNQSNRLPELVIDDEKRFDPFPLSGIQETYFIGRSGAYDLADIATQAYWETDAEYIDLERLDAAWNVVIARHDMLRMVLTDGQQQKILPSVPTYKVMFEDLSSLTETMATERLEEIRVQLWKSHRDGYTWPLFENRVTKISDGKFYFHLIIDALCLDGWSTLLLLQELMAAYIGKAQQLPEIRVRYRDYLLTEKSIHVSTQYQKSKQYWLERIPHLPSAPELPLKRNRTDKAAGRFHRREFSLDQHQWNKLQKRARQLDVTPSNLLLSAYCSVLSVWSSQPHFLINLTLFNRLPLHPQINEVLGDFTSLTLLEIKGSSSFKNLAKSIQKQLWLDLEHRYFGGVDVLREIVRTSGNQQKATIPVVFTSMLAAGQHDYPLLDDVPEGDASFVNGKGRGKSQTSQVWLDHVVLERNGELYLTWDAIDDLFYPGTLDGMFESYQGFIKKLLDDDTDLNNLGMPILPQSQIEQRRKVNDTGIEFPLVLLHELVKKQVEKTPDFIALIDGDINISYAQLWRISGVVANKISAIGVGPNQLVAILMRKGWEQVIACLAILRTGAAYLPIDASLPEHRINQIMSIGKVRIAITQEKINAEYFSKNEICSVVIDESTLAGAESAADDIDLPGKSVLSDLAYVIFTSGSTGEPKGVMIDHQGAVNTILDINQRFSISSQDSVLALSALNFDLSVYDIFGLLAVGARVVIPDEQELRNPGYWLKLIEQHQVTIFNSVPALALLLTEYVLNQNHVLPDSMRVLMMSGDWIPVTLPAKIREAKQGKDIAIYSLGGATEASIWSIYFPIHSVNDEWASIPYGSPLGNQTLHVLHSDLSHCPTWVEGDIYIGGVGVAKGYWGDQEKTQKSFIQHPQYQGTLYNTGDRGRYLADGNIEFLGRKDGQVKINGYRVELEEIETLLLKHDSVQNAVSSIYQNQQGGSSLLAHVVLNNQNALPAQTGFNNANDDLDLSTAEKLALKINKPAIQNKYSCEQAIALSRPEAVYTLGEWFFEDPAITQIEASTSIQELGNWLGCLAQYVTGDAVLPKYFYPSAGSLNPVQTFIVFHKHFNEQLSQGVYYYHPVHHGLHRVCDYEIVKSCWPTTSATISSIFVAEMAAIQPIYGPVSRSFCEMEAGYMIELLRQHGYHHQFSLTKNSYDIDPLAIRNALNLVDTQECLCIEDWSIIGGFTAPEKRVLQLLQRQSFREFLGEEPSLENIHKCLAPLAQLVFNDASYFDSVNIYLLKKILPSTEKPNRGELYKFSATDSELVLLKEEVTWRDSFQYGENELVFERSSFAIFITGTTANNPSHLFSAIGRMGQALMMQSVYHGIGFCPIGSVNSDALQEILSFGSDAKILHSFVGGGVTPDQCQRLSIEPHEPAKEPIEELHQYLAERLPSYMVPDHIICVNDIPLSPNGKVARDKLPKPEFNVRTQKAYVPARNDIEAKLIDLWKKILGNEHIGVRDNFFEVGGNSMLLIRVHGELKGLFGIEIPMVELFRNSNIESLAKNFGATGSSDNDFCQARERANKKRNATRLVRNSKSR